MSEHSCAIPWLEKNFEWPQYIASLSQLFDILTKNTRLLSAKDVNERLNKSIMKQSGFLLCNYVS